MLPVALSILSACGTVSKVPAVRADVTLPVYDSIGTHWRLMARNIALKGGLTPVGGNSMDIYTDGHSLFEVLNADILSSGKSLDMEYYRFSDDSVAREVRDNICESAAGGTKARLIMESRANPINPSFYNKMRNTDGIEMVTVQPLRDIPGRIANIFIRDHRKITVIDDSLAYTGGMNIRAVYRDDWRDTQVRLSGPIVDDFRHVFESNWNRFSHSGPTEIPASATPKEDGGVIMQIGLTTPTEKVRAIQEGFELALVSAKDYIYIQTPYFCPPESTMRLMEDAVKRGVDVRIMLPDTQDVPIMLWVNHYFYRRLIGSGVKIYERGLPFMHCKTWVADDYVSCYGSANIDNRSFNLNYENTLYVYDEETAVKSRKIFEEDLSHSRMVTLDDARWNILETGLQHFFICIGYPQW